MSTIRVRKDERYFSASNEAFNDKRLSWEARGLMGYLLSKPDGWKVRMEDLEKNGPAGTHKLRRMLAELRRYGYMNRIRTVNADKTFDWLTDVYESPSQNPHPSKTIQKGASMRFSTSGSSTSGKVPDVLSTDLTNTEELAPNGAKPPEKPKTPKKDGVDWYVDQIKPAMTIRNAISEYFRLNVNWDTKTARQWMEWAHGENITAQQIQVAAETWGRDKRFNWRAPNLQLIYQNWQLLTQVEVVEPLRML